MNSQNPRTIARVFGWLFVATFDRRRLYVGVFVALFVAECILQDHRQ